MQKVKRVLAGAAIGIVLLNLATLDHGFSVYPSLVAVEETVIGGEIELDYSSHFEDESDLEDLASSERSFNSSGLDTLVFVHIQKTGGSTLERRFVEKIDHHACDKVRKHKRRNCPRPLVHANLERNDVQPPQPGTWIFSRFSTGWECGLHADWTELRDCVAPRMDALYGVKERKLIYITNLRSPVQRFLSEWKHVQRGATWKTSTLHCGGADHTSLTTLCFPGRETWSDVGLEEFLECDSNLAFNRQTRMLANLNEVGCYDSIFNLTSVQSRDLLDSAKRNLSRMRWFGLVEYQQASQFMFEGAFYPLHFIEPFSRWNSTNGDEELKMLAPEIVEKIRQRNHLDIELYKFAERLFFQRLKEYKKHS